MVSEPGRRRRERVYWPRLYHESAHMVGARQFRR